MLAAADNKTEALFKNMTNSKMENYRLYLRKILFDRNKTAATNVTNALIIGCVLISVFVISLDSVSNIKNQWGSFLKTVELAITIFFTFEYFIRLLCAANLRDYAFGFYGIVDLISILPTYIGLFYPGVHYLGTVRIFRVLKFCQYFEEVELFFRALRASRKRITVFLYWVLMIVIMIGSFMYVIEGPENGYTSIPTSIYWTVVTITTVGYGDIAPKTVLGQMVSVLVMLIGYGIICVPTGVVASEVVKQARTGETRMCKKCNNNESDAKASFCKRCGDKY